MSKGKWYLAKFEIGVFLVVVGSLAVLEIGLPLLFAYIVGDLAVFWKTAAIWLMASQLTYLTYYSAKKLKQQFKAVDAVTKAIKDALDVINTEESIDIEFNDVRPN